MKRILPTLTALLFLLSSCAGPTAEVTPTPEPTPTAEITLTPEETANALPWSSEWAGLRWMIHQGGWLFYPFVYTEDPGWAWAREIIGDCSALVPGYLYLQDNRTKELAQILEEPVNMFCSDEPILYCLMGDCSSILRTDYFGADKTVLYTAQYGVLACLTHQDGILLFSDGDHVIRFDTVSGQEEDMGIYEGIIDICFEDDGTFTWINADGIEYARDENGHDEIIPPWGYYDGPLEGEEDS